MPHRYWLFTPELQCESRGTRRISQGWHDVLGQLVDLVRREKLEKFEAMDAGEACIEFAEPCTARHVSLVCTGFGVLQCTGNCLVQVAN